MNPGRSWRRIGLLPRRRDRTRDKSCSLLGSCAEPRCILDVHGSLSGRRLPQLDLVPLRIDDPAELPVLRIIHLVEDVAALRLERGNQCLEVVDKMDDSEYG